MNYYPHHIGDFNSSTRHLTRVERSLYRDLIELYYDTEKPLPADDFDRLARRVIAVTDEEKGALKYVLGEFFILDGAVYRHERCELEIEKYHSSTSAKAKAGKASAEARAKKIATKGGNNIEHNEQNSTDVQHVFNGCSTNQEPRTKNQYISLSKNAKTDFPDPLDFDEHDQSDNSGQQSSQSVAADSCTGEQLQFTEQHLLLARTTGLGSEYSESDIQTRFDLFRCYKANANTLKPQSEWLSNWRTWCQREKVNHAKQPNRPTGNGRSSAQPRNESGAQRAMRLAQEASERIASNQTGEGH